MQGVNATEIQSPRIGKFDLRYLADRWLTGYVRWLARQKHDELSIGFIGWDILFFKSLKDFSRMLLSRHLRSR